MLGRPSAAMASKDDTFSLTTIGMIKPELDRAGGYLLDLSVAVRARIAVIHYQVRDRGVGSIIGANGWTNALAATSRALHRPPRAGGTRSDRSAYDLLVLRQLDHDTPSLFCTAPPALVRGKRRPQVPDVGPHDR